MCRATSRGTGWVYGVERVCTVWGVTHSSLYAEQQRRAAEPARPTARRRGTECGTVGRPMGMMDKARAS